MYDFLINNAELIGGMIVMVALAIYAILTKQWGALRSLALSLMFSAERLFRTVEGKERFEKVFAELWEKVPPWIKRFYDKNKLRAKLQEWYDLAKDMIKAQE